jgi:hypothetical protein
MMRIALLAILAFFICAYAARADVLPSFTGAGTGVVYTMCSAEADLGTCESGGDEIVLDAAGLTEIHFDASESTATTFTCDIKANNAGHDAANGVGQDMSATSLSETQTAITIEGGPRHFFIDCSAIADNQVTVKAFDRRIAPNSAAADKVWGTAAAAGAETNTLTTVTTGITDDQVPVGAAAGGGYANHRDQWLL